MDISPKYLMALIEQVEEKIWGNFSSYKNVRNYISKWHKTNNSLNWNDFEENFKIYNQKNGKIDLSETLHNIDSVETILKIAIDLGIETPDFIPAVPSIKNILKQNHSTAFNSFQKCLKQVEEDPSLAVGLANSTLESIIKHILVNDNISIKLNKRDTLHNLTQSILKEFALYPTDEMPVEVRNIGSSLLNLAQNIEGLRSEKTTFHGKIKEDLLIEDPIYAYFIVNTISTVGLFLMSFYEKKFNNLNIQLGDENKTDKVDVDDLPF